MKYVVALFAVALFLLAGSFAYACECGCHITGVCGCANCYETASATVKTGAVGYWYEIEEGMGLATSKAGKADPAKGHGARRAARRSQAAYGVQYNYIGGEASGPSAGGCSGSEAGGSEDARYRRRIFGRRR